MTAPYDGPGVRSVIGVDAGTVSLREADHLVHALVDRLALPPGTFVCTHLIRTANRRGTAISLALPTEEQAEKTWQSLTNLASPDLGVPGLGESGLAVPGAGASSLPVAFGLGVVFGLLSCGGDLAVRGARAAAAEHVGREAGRAVVFPGVERLTGTVTVADVLALTAVDGLTVLGSPDAPDPATPVVTRDHVRPEWRRGRLTLALVPAAGGALAPFEVPNPTPCCADHI